MRKRGDERVTTPAWSPPCPRPPPRLPCQTLPFATDLSTTHCRGDGGTKRERTREGRGTQVRDSTHSDLTSASERKTGSRDGKAREAPGKAALRIYRQRHWNRRRQLTPLHLSRERWIARA